MFVTTPYGSNAPGASVCPFVNRENSQRFSLTRQKTYVLLHYEACAGLTFYKHSYSYINSKHSLSHIDCLSTNRYSVNLLFPPIYIPLKRYFGTNRSIRLTIFGIKDFSPIGKDIHIHSKDYLCNKLFRYLSTGLRVIYLLYKSDYIHRNKSSTIINVKFRSSFKIVVSKK